MVVPLLIGKEEVRRDEVMPVRSPATGEVFDYVVRGTRDDVRAAVEAAAGAWEAWAATPIYKRSALLLRVAELMRQRHEELARTMAIEAGKPIRDARVEVTRAIGVFTYAAEESRRMLDGSLHRVDAYEYPAGNENRMVMTWREPMGVVGSILPFNFPVNSYAHKVAPALAVGNTVVVKPSSVTPLSAIKMTNLLLDAGVPRGVVNVVAGPSGEVGEALLSDPRVSLITFTGSTEVGLRVAAKAASDAKRMIMELGGSDPFIVLEDADVAAAATTAVRARFEYAGQNCNSGKRFIVHRGVAEKFRDLFLEKARQLRVGDVLDESTDVGPVIGPDSVEEMERFVEDAASKGGRILLGGARLERPGYYFAPTIVDDATLGMEIAMREVFGPVAPIIKVESDEEAVEAANSVPYGLQSAIYTRDYKRALRLARRIQAGAVMINDSTRLRWDALPFGGVKKTGFGREGVRDTMLEMTEVKLVSLNLG